MTKQHGALAYEKRQRRAYVAKQLLHATRHLLPNRRTGTSIASVLVIVTGSIILFWSTPSLGKDLSNMFAYPEVRDVLLFADDRDAFGGRLGTIGVWGIQTFRVAGQSTVFDYAQRAGISAAIVPGAMGEGKDIVLLGDYPKQLTVDGREKTALAVSSDGATIAYAELATTTDQALDKSALRSWDVYTIDLGTGGITKQGTGYRPQFFMTDGINYLAYTSEAGVTIVNKDTRQSFTTPIVAGTSTDDAVTFSEDGNYVAANNPATNTTTLFAVRGLSPDLRVTSLGTTNVHFNSLMAMHENIFGLIENEKGAVLWKLNPNNPSKPLAQYAFTSSFLPTRLLEGN